MMRATLTMLAVLAGIACTHAASPTTTPPTGPLPNLARPTAYRLQLVIDPAQATLLRQ